MNAEKALKLMQKTISVLCFQSHRLTGLPVDDLKSECYLTLLRLCERYDPSRAKFKTYATKRLRGCLIDYAETVQKVACVPLTYDVPALCLLCPIEDQEADREAFERLISGLIPSWQEVLRLRFWDGYDIGEVAQRLGKQKANMENTQKQALKRLRGMQRHDATTE